MDKLLPPYHSEAEAQLEASQARLGDVPVPIRSLWQSQNCPEELLPWLAWALSVDDWDPNWSSDIKRTVIQNSVSLHRKKGTVGALKQAISSVGLSTNLTEWFEDNSTPYTFKTEIEITQTAVDLRKFEAIERQIDLSKNVRSHYGIEVQIHSVGTASLLLGATLGDILEIYPYLPTELTLSAQPFSLATTLVTDQLVLLPKSEPVTLQASPTAQTALILTDHLTISS